MTFTPGHNVCFTATSIDDKVLALTDADSKLKLVKRDKKSLPQALWVLEKATTVGLDGRFYLKHRASRAYIALSEGKIKIRTESEFQEKLAHRKTPVGYGTFAIEAMAEGSFSLTAPGNATRKETLYLISQGKTVLALETISLAESWTLEAVDPAVVEPRKKEAAPAATPASAPTAPQFAPMPTAPQYAPQPQMMMMQPGMGGMYPQAPQMAPQGPMMVMGPNGQPMMMMPQQSMMMQQPQMMQLPDGRVVMAPQQVYRQ
jgi:hypothetical protein|eukprot:gnl/Ergobibamus_cyprinoides/2348.p1 GENE.gnl/Ergobibamus_cyprinoides/2348~~gnl/Ergobibamus_cyprinoides/2348.p1  ORF type:complete len:260 (+),score=80.81 gnl/Ergobibamus_cyprinoides/2348:230-1009(+)